MKITPNQLRELAKSAPIFADHFNAAADEIQRQNEVMSAVADIAISRNDEELFKVVVHYQDESLINEIKADAICDAIKQSVMNDDHRMSSYAAYDIMYKYAEKIKAGEK